MVFYFSYEILLLEELFTIYYLLLEELIFTTDIKTHTPLEGNCWLNIITSSTPFCFQMSFALKITVGQAASQGGITEHDICPDIG